MAAEVPEVPHVQPVTILLHLMRLIIDSISKTYPGGVQALKNITLTLNEGLYGLLGPNGAGKSSLMRTLATLQQVDKGSIFLDDIDVLKQKTEVRRLLGYLPQEFGVYPKVSAEEMLDHIAQLKGVEKKHQRRELVDFLLNKVNLLKDKKKKLGTYSGGMKQRFGIAQALIGDPKLIIVDEPTAGLDPVERNHFYNLLSQLGKNTTVLLSTHIVEDVNTLCSHFAIIFKGEVVYTGMPDESVKELEGKVFSRMIDQESGQYFKEKYNVISTQLRGGNMYIRILSETGKENGFELCVPNLEDVYFSNIARIADASPF